MRLINADTLTDKLETFMEWDNAGFVQKCIDEAPTIEAEPVRHGRWELADEQEPRRYGCSECKRLAWDISNYCPNCGARMDGDE